MTEDAHHDQLLHLISEEYADIFESSTQGVYIYLDDAHKACNEKFANMLGYTSPLEWAKVPTSFPEAFVARESQETLITAFQDAMEHAVGSTNSIVWKKKDGSTVHSMVILVPIVYDGHMFALHYIT